MDRFERYGVVTCDGPSCPPGTPAQYLTSWVRPDGPTFCRCSRCSTSPACGAHVDAWGHSAALMDVQPLPVGWRPWDGWPQA